MSNQEAKQNITTSITSSGVIHQRQRIVQNFLLIWMDASIDESKKDCQNILGQLRSVVNDVNVFTEPDQCVQFLNGIDKEKAFIVASDSLAQHLVPNIHALPQLDAIYIFCSNTSRNEQWTKEWVKIKGVHTDIRPICEALQLVAKQCNQDFIAVGFVPASDEASSENLDDMEVSFYYTQITKEIVLKMKPDKKSIKDLAVYCRKFYDNNMAELDIIDEFEHTYRSKLAIWWYTRECFIYQMLNRALRTFEDDTIIHMGFFIRDLHQQIERLYQEQVGGYNDEPFTIYRGQGLLKTNFDKLVKSKGGLMSFDNFLSTNKNQDVSLVVAKDALTKIDMVGILFKMTIDPAISSVPFASIREVSYFKKEEEILFSMPTVFRIVEIIKIDNNDSLYQVNLKLIGDDHQELYTVTERLRKEVVDAEGWTRLGTMLLASSQYDKAEELYTVLLVKASDQGEKAFYYSLLGLVKHYQDDYKKAIEYHKKGLEIREKNIPPNHNLLATYHNNIGRLYKKLGDDSKALSSYEKALEIQKALPPNHLDFATSYNNIGSMYDDMGEYSKALLFYEKALEIRRNALPPNHPDLASSSDNIGVVYQHMGEYSKALSFYEISLEIREKAISPNHYWIAASCNNIGSMYDGMGEYAKALSFYEQSLELYQKTIPPNHPMLTVSYNDIGLMYKKVGEYSKALSFYEKTREIYQEALVSNDPGLATYYNNIASVHEDMEDYPRALAYFERSLDIIQHSLPPDHPDGPSVRTAIERVKNKM